jgi:gamma-glutamylputrescine oxidase
MPAALPHVDSWYAASANRELAFDPASGDIETDVCIVGGGYTGLSSALYLRERGYRVTLLEARRIGWGASGRNGGHVGTGQRVDQATLEGLVGDESARALWDLGLEAVATVVELIDRFDIDCELKTGNLHVARSRAADIELREEAEHLQAKYAYSDAVYVPAKEVAELCSSTRFLGGLLDRGARHLHPLNYALGLGEAAASLGASLHESSPVTGYREEAGGVTVTTDLATVKAKYLVLACNGYLGRLAPALAGRIMPINNYMVATEALPEETARRLIRDDVSMSDSLFVINYWKLSRDNRLLFGGGESYTRRFPSDIRRFVRPYLLKIYPELAATTLEYGWGGTLAITMNRMPDFGRVGRTIFHAHGYSGHGVPTATLAGKLIAEVIDGTASRFDVMASVPTPRFPGGTLLRWPGLVAGMLFYSLRDRLAR